MESKFEDFLKKSHEKFGDKYDYSKVEYSNNQTKVCIICPKHGEFWQTPYSHLHSHTGCPKCGNEKMQQSLKKMTTDEFIEQAKMVHGDKYDYSKTKYQNNYTKVCIICPKHGEFWLLPKSHLNGTVCPKCKSRSKYSQEEIINKFRKVHGNKYDYSKVEYINCDTKVCIICPEHGEFWQKPCKHLKGQGCIKCGFLKNKIISTSTTEEFIEKARKIHGDKYDYSKVEYKHNAQKVCIICPEHGEFWQTPNNHLHGDRCPLCKMSKLEDSVKRLLDDNKINYIFQASKKDLDWCGRLKMDFYLPENNVIIECQGEQHFMPLDVFGGEITYNKQIQNDLKKFNLVTQHNIKMLYYIPNKSVNIELIIYQYGNTFSNVEDLLKKIQEG